jgi:hypothetical protein
MASTENMPEKKEKLERECLGPSDESIHTDMIAAAQIKSVDMVQVSLRSLARFADHIKSEDMQAEAIDVGTA